MSLQPPLKPTKACLQKAGAINGGFFPRKHDWSVQCLSIVIALYDMEESMRKMIEAGRKILGELI